MRRIRVASPIPQQNNKLGVAVYLPAHVSMAEWGSDIPNKLLCCLPLPVPSGPPVNALEVIFVSLVGFPSYLAARASWRTSGDDKGARRCLG